MKRPDAELKSKITGNKATVLNFEKLEKFLDKLEERDIPQAVQEQINAEIEKLNSEEKNHLKAVVNTFSKVVNLVEKELKLVPKNHYTHMWLALGMATFGMPIGVVFGIMLDNMAFLSLGIPIGMGIGVGVGKSMDNKAAAENRVLDVE